MKSQNSKKIKKSKNREKKFVKKRVSPTNLYNNTYIIPNAKARKRSSTHLGGRGKYRGPSNSRKSRSSRGMRRLYSKQKGK